MNIIRLLDQGYVATILKSLVQKFHGRRHERMDRYSESIVTIRFVQRVIVFISSFVNPAIGFYQQLENVSRKAEDVYPTDTLGPRSQIFSGVRVTHLLLFLCNFHLGYFMFFVECICFPCLVFVSGLRSLISARILVTLTTLIHQNNLFLGHQT